MPTPDGMTASVRAARAAPVVFVFLWSTGFIVARYSTDDAGPLTFLAIRLVIVTAILAAVSRAMSSARPSRAEVGWLSVTGTLMHAVYLGGVFIAVDQGLPSGVGALIAGLHPVVTSLLAGPILGERLRRIQWVGVALGFAGVVAVVVDRLLAKSVGVSVGPLLASSLSMLGMSAGTLIQRARCARAPLMWGSTVQYGAAAAVLCVGSVTVEGVDISFTASTWFSLAWSVFVLSIAAVLILMWLLQRQAAATVSSLFFLTPALSTVEAAILFDERFGPLAFAGLASGLIGVALVTRPAPG